MQFLVGLNELYNQIQGWILLIDPFPSINKVYSLLIQDESQRSIGHSNCAYEESIALVVKSLAGSTSFAYGNSYGNGSVGKGTKGKWKERLVCSHYGITGHTMESAISSIGIPLDTKPKERIRRLIKLLDLSLEPFLVVWN